MIFLDIWEEWGRHMWENKGLVGNLFFLEVVDERLHVVLHLGAGGRRQLAVVHLDEPGLELVEALDDQSGRLAHLLDSDEVAGEGEGGWGGVG